MFNLFKKFLIYGLVFAVMFILISPKRASFVRAYTDIYKGKGYDPFAYDAKDEETQGGEFKASLRIPKQASVGDEVSIIATMGGSGGFLSDSDYPHRFNWILAGRTVQPLVAGSEDKLNKDLKLENSDGILKNAEWRPFTIRDGAIGREHEGGGHGKFLNEGPPFSLTRTVKDSKGRNPGDPGYAADRDEDNDKMHDDWEIRYFRRFVGKEMPQDDGSRIVLPDPNADRLGFLNAIDAGVDFDGDGFNWRHETVKNVPGGKGSLGDTPDDDPWFSFEEGVSSIYYYTTWNHSDDDYRDDVDKVKGPTTGDGKFTNYEEYVFGLDPTSADTDQDGILDEADIVGIGNNNLTLRLDPSFAYSGRKIPVEVVASGLICVGEQNCPGDFQDGRWGLVWDKGDIIVTPGPALEVTLIADPEVPIPESGTEKGYPPVKVTAQVVGAENEAGLYYKWYIENTDVQVEGYGKSEFEFSIKDSPFNKPCQYNTIICDVSDEGTGRMGSADLKLEVGENITDTELDAYLVGNEMASDDTVDPCALKSPYNDYGKVKINDIIDGSGFVRQNDIIEIFANDNLDLCGKPKSDYIFQWFLDGKEQTDQSGKAEDKFRFTVTKSPGDEHLVKLKLIRISDGFEYGQLGEKVFTVQIPTATIEPPPLVADQKGCDEYYGETGLCRVILELGETQEVELKTILENFQPTYTDTFHYEWTFDGEVIREQDTTESQDSLTYEFTHPGGIAEEQIETHSVGITVDNYIDSDENVDESAADSYTVEVVLKTASGGAQGPVTRANRLFAQAGQAISSYFKNIFNIVLSIGIIGFIVFAVMAAGQFRKKE